MHRCVTRATTYTRETRSQNVSPDAICISSKAHSQWNAHISVNFYHLRETRPALMPSICENSITGQRFSKRLWSLLNSSSSYACIELARSCEHLTSARQFLSKGNRTQHGMSITATVMLNPQCSHIRCLCPVMSCQKVGATSQSTRLTGDLAGKGRGKN